MKYIYCSLNEIEVLTKKSARGIGMSWGLAEEASKIVRYLSIHQLGENINIFLGLLEKIEKFSYKELCPKNIFFQTTIASLWEAQNHYLCPIISGALMSDCAKYLPKKIVLKNIYYPILLLPTLAFTSKSLNVGFQITIDKLIFWILPSKVYYKNLSSKILLTANSKSVFVIKDAVSKIKDSKANNTTLLKPINNAIKVTAKDWERLNIFANKTYVKATIESRLKGAGSVLSDND